jgi:hypothetical protein
MASANAKLLLALVGSKDTLGNFVRCSDRNEQSIHTIGK